MASRVDDPTINDDETLWRRILPDWIHTEESGRVRAKSFAFIDRLSGELSVHIAAMTNRDAVLAIRPKDRIVAFKAGLPRSLGFAIVRDPTPDDPSHGLICPSPKGAKAKAIAEQAKLID
jgi:hypothetical protein